ncbi:MAG: hypothetical protein FI731_02395 [SAR202 cluster bacterium]|nr:hypothetical protein [SAR202 cluster bacterium]
MLQIRLKLVFLVMSAAILASIGAASDANPAAQVLAVSPNPAVANQTVSLLGTGFTPATTPGGTGSAGVHRITGTGGSQITVGGSLLTAPNVAYPINFDESGNWATSITIPVNINTVASGPLEIKVVDDIGLTLTTQLTLKSPDITISPASGGRTSSVVITGDGFPASNPATSDDVQINITYGGATVNVLAPNISGEISGTFQVPSTAAIPSINVVRATVSGYDFSAITAHSVPAAALSVSPESGLPGSIITIFGESFPSSALVTSMRAGNISVLSSPAPVTDAAGRFTSFFVVPLFLPGEESIVVTAGGTTAVTEFTVRDGPVVSQPTPSPDLTTGAAEALTTLTRGDNLVRVWHFDNGSKRWTFFDPRPAFANANTIKVIESGKVYWVQVNKNQSAMLNGKVVEVFQGWNLLPW